MNNKGFIFIGLAVITVTAFLIVYSKHDSSGSNSSVSASEDGTTNQFDQTKPSSSVAAKESKLAVFEKVAMPISSIPKDECLMLQDNPSFLVRNRQVTRAATKAYFSGSSKQEVADGIWAQQSWLEAARWYNKALDFELINRDLSILKSLPTADNVVMLLEKYNARLAAGEQLGYLINLKIDYDSVWSHVDLEQANRAILDDETVDAVLARLKDALSDVPFELLNNTQISPISNMISTAVESKRIDIAIALLNEYPIFTQFANPYENNLRANVVASLNYELNTEQLKNDADKLLGMLDLYNTPLAFYHLPGFFDRRRLSNRIAKLEKQNINISHQVMNEVDAPESSLLLWYDKEEYQLLMSKEAECEAKKTWMKSRDLTFNQWQQFAPDEFVSNVKNSFEYQYCTAASKTSRSMFKLEPEAIQNSFTLIRKHMQLTGKNVTEVEFNEINLPVMSDDQRAVFSVMLTRDLLRTNALSEQEIVRKLTQANLKPNTNNLAVLHYILLIDGFSLWLDDIDFNNIPKSYLLLNTLAEKGKFNLYNQLNGRIELNEAEQLDPFYFFIKGYSSLRNAGSKLNFTVTSNTEFTEYFMQSGINISPHHLRASYSLKLRNEKNYDDLIKDFPQLAVDQNDDYFSVMCE